MSDSSSDQEKPDKKKEYNRIAQRIFRQRRKEHLNKLEVAQQEANSAQNAEINRLRRENIALLQENELIKAAYRSQASSSEPSTTPTGAKGLPASDLSHGHSFAFLETATTISSSSSAPSMPNFLNPVVVVPNSIPDIRRTLYQLFSPLLDASVISDPQAHLATLQAIQSTLPTALKPTQLQLATPHHARIDMIPSPSLRDRLISIGVANSSNFLMEVCTISCEIEDTGQITIWGEDWLNEFSWEFSAAVIERWGGWLLTPEWSQRANFWRRQRGAALLTGFENLVEIDHSPVDRS